jgi:hypothetical protein
MYSIQKLHIVHRTLKRQFRYCIDCVSPWQVGGSTILLSGKGSREGATAVSILATAFYFIKEWLCPLNLTSVIEFLSIISTCACMGCLALTPVLRSRSYGSSISRSGSIPPVYRANFVKLTTFYIRVRAIFLLIFNALNKCEWDK